jgi:hypothetical protein
MLRQLSADFHELPFSNYSLIELPTGLHIATGALCVPANRAVGPLSHSTPACAAAHSPPPPPVRVCVQLTCSPSLQQAVARRL